MNADDYGLTPGVCEGILRAHREGIVTSTSVLTPAPAFEAHVGALRDSGLAAGLHLAVVGEDPPLLSASEIPSLVDRRGRFPLSWRQFMAAAARGAIDPADLDREFSAQHERLTGAGIRPSGGTRGRASSPRCAHRGPRARRACGFRLGSFADLALAARP